MTNKDLDIHSSQAIKFPHRPDGVIDDPVNPNRTSTDTLKPGQNLSRNETLISLNGRYELIMQNDGNLVLYRTECRTALWATNTHNTDCNRAVMQTDGNFVVYHEGEQAAWDSKTHGNPGSWLVLQDDGNLVVYKPQPVWASGTNQ